MTTTIIPLNAQFSVSYEGTTDNEIDYRAVLTRDDQDSMWDKNVRIEQKIDGAWHSTGGEWGIDSLGDCDGIYIDLGAKWLVERGMKAVFDEATKLINK